MPVRTRVLASFYQDSVVLMRAADEIRRRPGVREPIDCWERRADGADDEWRAFAPATAEYVAEMAVLMQVLAIHRAARAAY